MANDALLSVKVDGVRYGLAPGDFTALDDLAIKQAIGLTLAQVFRTLSDEPSLYGLAALLWRYRVNNGEKGLTFEQVASKVDFEAFRSIGEDDDGDDVPLAQDGS